MTKEQFNSLIQRYLSGEATLSEKRLIDNFFSSQKNATSPVSEQITHDMWKGIDSRVRKPYWTIRIARRIKFYHVLVPLTLLLMVYAGYFYRQYSLEQTANEWITQEVPYGQKSEIVLSDGSKVHMNSGSKITFRKYFNSVTPREVILSGEAFFEVVKNPKRPFLVKSSNVTTKVLGTSFNVRAFVGHDISVTVETGLVEVEAIINDQDSGSQVKQVLLNPMQQAVLTGRDWLTSPADLSKIMAWRYNTLRFDETTIADMASDLERWYNVSVNIKNERIRNCRINGQFKNQTLDDVLKSIRYMYKVDFEYSKLNQITLYGKGCNK